MLEQYVDNSMHIRGGKHRAQNIGVCCGPSAALYDSPRPPDSACFMSIPLPCIVTSASKYGAYKRNSAAGLTLPNRFLRCPSVFNSVYFGFSHFRTCRFASVWQCLGQFDDDVPTRGSGER
jgi:hypothetical protein